MRHHGGQDQDQPGKPSIDEQMLVICLPHSSLQLVFEQPQVEILQIIPPKLILLALDRYIMLSSLYIGQESTMISHSPRVLWGERNVALRPAFSLKPCTETALIKLDENRVFLSAERGGAW
jgi:hypothetical protein